MDFPTPWLPYPYDHDFRLYQLYNKNSCFEGYAHTSTSQVINLWECGTWTCWHLHIFTIVHMHTSTYWHHNCSCSHHHQDAQRGLTTYRANFQSLPLPLHLDYTATICSHCNWTIHHISVVLLSRLDRWLNPSEQLWQLTNCGLSYGYRLYGSDP